MIHFLAAASLMLITGSAVSAHPAVVPHTHESSEVVVDEGKMEAMTCSADAS